MRCLFFFLTGLFTFITCLSQDADSPPFKMLGRDYGKRGNRSVYDYHLDKIRKLVDSAPQTNQWKPNVLSDTAYSRLSLREQFAYNIVNEESFTQSCYIFSVDDEEHQLFAWLLMEDFGVCWSQRQRNYFRDNRDSVIGWMKEGIEADGRIGVNYKRIIVQLEAKEMIPLIIRKYNGDHDVLTVLMLLMKAGKYTPFTSLELYKDLYERPKSLRKAYIRFTPGYEKVVLEKARDFYNDGLAR